MESELDVIDGLNALAYIGNCLQNDVLTRALEGGPRNADFRQLVVWLTHELHILRKTDEEVSPELDDPSDFAMELSAMLKELGCPYAQFVTGPLSERFETRIACMQLCEYLISELMATKMCLRLRPAEKTYVIPKLETNTARALESLVRDLCLQKPPANIPTKALFDKLNFKVEERQRQVNPAILSKPLLHTPKPLTDAQWKVLDNIHEEFDAEYKLRRQVLLTRLEVTIQSFQWSDSMKMRQNEILERFQSKMQELEALKNNVDVTNIVALLAARADLAIIEKTSSANVRKNTGSKIQKHVIGGVPDRGGRAHEHAPPPPEMPSWQQQRAGPPGGRGGGGNFRGGRGEGRGGGGRGGGRGGGGGGNWQLQSAPQQQRPQSFDQGRDQNWISGTGRVQGTGWSQRGNDRGGGNNFHGGDRGGNNNYQSNDRGDNSHFQRRDSGGDGGGRGGGNSYRGRSNYNRGGAGGGGQRR